MGYLKDIDYVLVDMDQQISCEFLTIIDIFSLRVYQEYFEIDVVPKIRAKVPTSTMENSNH